MHSALDQRDTLLAAWRTNNRVTVFLVEHLPHELWGAKVPGSPRRTVRMIAGHIHNARCTWIKTLGKEHGIAVPCSFPNVLIHVHRALWMWPAIIRTVRRGDP